MSVLLGDRVGDEVGELRMGDWYWSGSQLVMCCNICRVDATTNSR
jgi:hypothetical protein